MQQFQGSGGCHRALIEVTVESLLRGVRHYWCFHTMRFKHKFDLKIRNDGNTTVSMVLKRLVVCAPAPSFGYIGYMSPGLSSSDRGSDSGSWVFAPSECPIDFESGAYESGDVYDK